MNEKEQLVQDIKTLKESIRLNWIELGPLGLARGERKNIRALIQPLIEDLKDLYRRLDEAEPR
jgi:hypothetical protein